MAAAGVLPFFGKQTENAGGRSRSIVVDVSIDLSSSYPTDTGHPVPIPQFLLKESDVQYSKWLVHSPELAGIE